MTARACRADALDIKSARAQACRVGKERCEDAWCDADTTGVRVNAHKAAARTVRKSAVADHPSHTPKIYLNARTRRRLQRLSADVVSSLEVAHAMPNDDPGTLANLHLWTGHYLHVAAGLRAVLALLQQRIEVAERDARTQRRELFVLHAPPREPPDEPDDGR